MNLKTTFVFALACTFFLFSCTNPQAPPKDCGDCPMLSPPAPDYCKGGNIVSGGTDDCGCQQPPRCEIMQKVCTEDAKECPDGSFVGRDSQNNCEFFPCDYETRESCTDAGGDWGQFGKYPVPRCNLPTKDGGADCKDNSDCESDCLGKDEKSTSGLCSDWKLNYGCYVVIMDGHSSTICRD
ncbi:MAG: hypothetical protein ABIJ34_03280 [archaeon]